MSYYAFVGRDEEGLYYQINYSVLEVVWNVLSFLYDADSLPEFVDFWVDLVRLKARGATYYYLIVVMLEKWDGVRDSYCGLESSYLLVTTRYAWSTLYLILGIPHTQLRTPGIDLLTENTFNKARTWLRMQETGDPLRFNNYSRQCHNSDWVLRITGSFKREFIEGLSFRINSCPTFFVKVWVVGYDGRPTTFSL
ncbi:hypothetical protein K435DRAFT_793593 [Dendrothele bispora CBS 962.96]|uniref:Uncharacterized protein n=1 Tax=Dendrothele bispora (strain CBS 962.96) TaxID=1314807 RepID=A0A4S8MFE3_DENBC|nr:hypothetical protein K435DRAFT_793593 [Dendrothele bispora CBS 962.96]